MSNKSLIALVTGVLLVILAWNSFYIVRRPSVPFCCASVRWKWPMFSRVCIFACR